MRNLYRILVAAFVVIAATACSQFEEQDALPSGDENLVAMTISVGGEPTRTYISEDGKSLNWCENDKIAIFDGVGKREFTIVEGSIEGGYAEFEGKVDAAATSFFAVYPYEAAGEYDSQAGTVSATAATAQQLEGENVSDGAVLSVAQFEKGAESFDFKTAVGYFSVDITFEDITSIIVRGANVAGTATFNAAGEVQSVSEGADQVTLTPSGDVFAAGSYYVALLPGTSPAGEFSVMLTRAEGEALEMTSTKDIEIPRNGGFFLSDYKLVKKLVIKDAASLQQFLATAHTLAESEEIEVTANIDLKDVELTGATSFAGTLAGNGYSLLNWESNGVSLFETLSGTVKNLKFDSTCSLTPADAAGPFGFLAKTVAAGGVVSYCENHADITLNSVKYASGTSQIDYAAYFGALVGQNFGTIDHSKNSGDITITTNPETTGSSQRGMVYIGGVAGIVNNTDQLAAGGSLTGLSYCENSGNINYSIASGKKGGFVFMGGIVGGTPCENMTKAIPEKTQIDNCVNTGNISHIYPEGAIAIGGGTLNSNYTYVAGVVGYCEGSISNCHNGAQGNSNLGAVILSTPTLAEDYVISRTTVGGVAGFVMAGGTTCNNYASISVTGCFGKGYKGYGSSSSYAGGGAEAGVSVAGVIAQVGINNYFNDNTLSQCHNHGVITCNFNMADQQTPHYVGGCVAVSHLVTGNMTNNAAITVNTKGYSNYVGGVLGYTKYGSSNLTNNAAGNIDCNLNRDSSNDDQLANNHYVGGVVGCAASGQTIATTSNNSQWTKCTVAEGVTVVGKIFHGGVLGQGAITNDATNNSAVTLTAQTSTGEINLGGVAGDVLGASDDLENNGNVNFTAVDVATAYVGGLAGSGTSKLENSTNNRAVTVNATTNIDTLGLGGLLGETSAITLTSNTNNGALSTNAGEVLHIGGLVGHGAGAITASSCTNSAAGTATLTNANLELTEVAAGGLCGRGTNKTVFTSCENAADVTLNAKSATTAYLAGISAMPTNASAKSSFATNAVSCTNTGDLYANFPATWYVGGAVAFSGCWSSTAANQFKLTDNTIECDIEIDANPVQHFVGGLVGHSGQHTTISGNSYKGNITVGNSTNDVSFTGGLFGAMVLSGTSTNTNLTYYNYTLQENEVDCVISSSGYCAALIGGQYNSTTSTVRTAPIFKYIYNEDKPNKVLSGTTINSVAITADNLSTFVRSSYADDTRFTVTEEGLPAGVVFE